MNLLLIGATRGIGRALAECALNDNHRVRILARKPDKIVSEHPNLEIWQGDILDRSSLREAIEGQDGVCSCIGRGITFHPVTLFSEGAANIVEVLGSRPQVKYIAVTGVGAGDTKGHGGFLYDSIFKPLFLRTIYEDKDREEEIIRASPLTWLIVRPAGLTNGKRTGHYRVVTDLEGVVAGRISRLDVADYILKQFTDPTDFHQTPLLTY
jgi:putative NADH-flavin reductase